MATTNTDDPVTLAELDLAASRERVRELGRMLQDGAGTPFEGAIESEYDAEWERMEHLSDNLRLLRDGYAQTYPHPCAMHLHGRRYPCR